MRTHVFKLRRLVRRLMQQPLDPSPLRRFPIIVFLWPRGFDFDNKRFAIGIKRISHRMLYLACARAAPKTSEVTDLGYKVRQPVY
jgi:hypothetical protein